MEAANLREKFNRALSSLGAIELSDDRYALSIICMTNWVRILIVRDQESNTPTIEVELSPSFNKKRVHSDFKVESSISDDHQSEAVRRISAMMTHLSYLLRLGQVGFRLRISEEDCLWTASLQIDGKLDNSIFDALIPPVPV